MIGLWLTTIGLFIMLLISVGIFLYSVNLALDPYDSKKVDPLPKLKQ